MKVCDNAVSDRKPPETPAYLRMSPRTSAYRRVLAVDFADDELECFIRSSAETSQSILRRRTPGVLDQMIVGSLVLLAVSSIHGGRITRMLELNEDLSYFETSFKDLQTRTIIAATNGGLNWFVTSKAVMEVAPEL